MSERMGAPAGVRVGRRPGSDVKSLDLFLCKLKARLDQAAAAIDDYEQRRQEKNTELQNLMVESNLLPSVSNLKRCM